MLIPKELRQLYSTFSLITFKGVYFSARFQHKWISISWTQKEKKVIFNTNICRSMQVIKTLHEQWGKTLQAQICVSICAPICNQSMYSVFITVQLQTFHTISHCSGNSM